MTHAGTVKIDAGKCTFCGWCDPADNFDFHTPGGAPVCHTCAVEGVLGLEDATEYPFYAQGESNYASGRLRVKYKNDVLYQNSDKRNLDRLKK